MKKTLLFVCLSFFISTSWSQNFLYDTTTSITITDDADGLYEFSLHFLPSDSSDITFKWQRLENTLDTNWSYSLCDYNNCYTDIPDSAKMARLTMAKYEDGVYGFFKLLVNTDEVPRSGTLRLWLYDSANVTVGDTVTFHLITNEVIDTTDTTGATGLGAIEANQFQIFPNPALNEITIFGLDIQSFEVIDILGRTIMDGNNLTNNSAQLDISRLNPGTYFIRVLTSEGSYRMDTFIKQ
jgi:hypothetical protein